MQNGYDHLIGYNIIEISRKVNVMMNKALGQIDLTFPQYRVLSRLFIEEGLSHKDLGERLSLTSQTLTPILALLERKGWIERKKNTEDGRHKFVFLTDLGIKKRHEAFEIVMIHEKEYFQIFGTENTHQLLEWLHAINMNLKLEI
ncbi:MAG: MarR family transcriptional regulator [Clostridia bacterium]|nr:MarR family transcriptional regulator [Clostridia bacterium]